MTSEVTLRFPSGLFDLSSQLRQYISRFHSVLVTEWVSKTQLFTNWLSVCKGTNKGEKTERACRQHNLDNTNKSWKKFIATITKWKFIIWEDLDKMLNWKEKFIVSEHMKVRISLQKIFYRSKGLCMSSCFVGNIMQLLTLWKSCFVSSVTWPIDKWICICQYSCVWQQMVVDLSVSLIQCWIMDIIRLTADCYVFRCLLCLYGVRCWKFHCLFL